MYPKDIDSTTFEDNSMKKMASGVRESSKLTNYNSGGGIEPS
jgi:hypothetical protein